MASAITCLVDDEVRPASGLLAEHGLSFLVETEEDAILFDTGASGETLLYNASILGLELRRISALVISHSHPDHTGGMRTFLSLVPGCKVFAHPAIFRERFARRRRRKPKYVGLPFPRRELEKRSELHLSRGPILVASHTWTSGEITERPEAEGGSARHLIRTPQGLAPDNYPDDLALVVETGRGLVVVLGCGHAGLLNTLAQVRRTFGGEIQALLGGAHLLDLGEEEIVRIISILREEYGSPRVYLNHCTGKRALEALESSFQERVRAYPAGTRMVFD